MKTKIVYGHSTVRALLEQEAESGSWAHSYLFLGPAGVGKYLVAKQFAGRILGRSAADLFEIDLAEQNSMEDLRQFLSVISVRPVGGKHKVALLNNFELASPNLANAMLKTLEEPSPSTVIILVSSKQLLPTIVSRCRVVAFNRLSASELAEFAQAEGLQASPEVLEIAAGSPGRLFAFSGDNETQAIFEWADRLAESYSLPVSEKLMLVSELGAEEASTLREVLMAFLERQRAKLGERPELASSMRKTMEALDLLRFNLNKKLVLQRLLL